MLFILYSNYLVLLLKDKSYDELANRRMNNVTLSSRDYDDVFENVIKRVDYS